MVDFILKILTIENTAIILLCISAYLNVFQFKSSREDRLEISKKHAKERELQCTQFREDLSNLSTMYASQSRDSWEHVEKLTEKLSQVRVLLEIIKVILETVKGGK